MGAVSEADIAHYHEHGHATIRRLLPHSDGERTVERFDGHHSSAGSYAVPSWKTPNDPRPVHPAGHGHAVPINASVLAALHGNRAPPPTAAPCGCCSAATAIASTTTVGRVA